MYEKIAAKVLPNGGFVYLWHPQVLIAHSDKLEGYKQMPDGLVRRDRSQAQIAGGAHLMFFGPRASRSLMIMSERDARGPEHER